MASISIRIARREMLALNLIEHQDDWLEEVDASTGDPSDMSFVGIRTLIARWLGGAVLVSYRATAHEMLDCGENMQAFLAERRKAAIHTLARGYADLILSTVG